MIDVENGHRHRLAAAGGAAGLACQCVLEEAAVVKPRKLIADRLAAQLLAQIQIGKCKRHLLGEHGGELIGALGKGRPVDFAIEQSHEMVLRDQRLTDISAAISAAVPAVMCLPASGVTAHETLAGGRNRERGTPPQCPAVFQRERRRCRRQFAPIRAARHGIARFVHQIERPRLLWEQEAGVVLDRCENFIRRLARLQDATEFGQQYDLLGADFRSLERRRQPGIRLLQLACMLTALGIHLHRVGLVLDHPENLAGRQWLAISFDQQGRPVLSAQMQFGLGRHGAVADRRQRCAECCAVGLRRQQGVDRIARQLVR